MKPVKLGCVTGLLLVLGSSHVAAQSLAEIARQEKLRRQTLAEKDKTENTSPKVYTNADLRGARRLTVTGGGPPPPAASPAAEAATPPAGDTPTTEAGSGDEAQWRDRIEAVRQAQERARLMAAALQNRVDGLWTDFASRDDPAQRAVIEESRQAALAELESTGAEVEALTQQIADIQEEARRASVPPGWLR
jgi:hypothetical protein